MKRIAVYCGSSLGGDANFVRVAGELGNLMGRKGIGVVYGGGNIGLMGKLATAALEAGGQVTGVMPRFMMEKEVGRIDLTELRVVESMHERKAVMADLADGFIAMPGGFGTLEEMCETLTWGQLGLHSKPFGMLNVAGFYDHFLAFLDHAVTRGMIKAKHREMLMVDDVPRDLLARMAEWKGELGKRWMTPERT